MTNLISDKEAAKIAALETPPHFSDGRTTSFGGRWLTWQCLAHAFQLQGANREAAEHLAKALRPKHETRFGKYVKNSPNSA